MLDLPYQIIGIGSNCYLRNIFASNVKHYPTEPWAWQMFLDASSLQMYLTEKTIEEVVDSFEITEVINDTCVKYFNSKYLIYAPHVHSKNTPFVTLESSKDFIFKDIKRKLERLKKNCESKPIVFVSSASVSYNNNNILYNGYDYSKYENDTNNFLYKAKEQLNIENSIIFLKMDTATKLKQCKEKMNLTEINEYENFYKFKNINNGFLLETPFTTSNSINISNEIVSAAVLDWSQIIKKLLQRFC